MNPCIAGNAFIKAARVSPDAFFQMILQLAYFRDQGHLVGTYETGKGLQLSFLTFAPTLTYITLLLYCSLVTSL
jgi:hypothetical protein